MATQPVIARPGARTFHEHGAVEIRCTVLVNDARVDIHVLDVENVMAKQPDLAPALKALLGLAEGHADADKVTITPDGIQK